MNIKTISNGNTEKFDELVSNASKELNAKFTQTHATDVGGNIIYTAVLFYD